MRVIAPRDRGNGKDLTMRRLNDEERNDYGKNKSMIELLFKLEVQP